jgi:uncharacterized protein involved in cysteine biosynthesis
MNAVLDALAKAFGQLTDRAVLMVLAKSVLVTILVLAVLGVAAFAGLTMLFAWAGWDEGGYASAAAAVVLVGIAGWLLFRVIALAVLQFFADEVVIAVETKHYPKAAETARKLPFAEDLANSLRGIGRTLGVNLLALPVALVLLVTGVGPALVFLAVNAWLLGRELTDMAWLRHKGHAMPANPVPKPQRVLLGLAVAGIMLIPFANLIAPVVGAAAGTHLTHGAMARAKAESGDA